MKAIALADHLTEWELIEKIRHEKASSVGDRYRAILWLQQGKSRDEIAERLGVGCNTVCRWVKGYNSSGETGLHPQPGQGRKRTITPEKVEQIKGWVNSVEGVWTLNRMSIKLADEEGILELPKRSGIGFGSPDGVGRQVDLPIQKATRTLRKPSEKMGYQKL